MTVGRGFELHPLAAQDITGIWTYIAEDSPQAARRVREGGHTGRYSRIGVLSQSRSPTSGPDFATSAFCRGTRIPDRLHAGGTPLWVIAVMHGRRSPRVMAAILRGRE